MVISGRVNPHAPVQKDPDNAAVKKALVVLKKRSAAQDAKERKALGGMFDKFAKQDLAKKTTEPAQSTPASGSSSSNSSSARKDADNQSKLPATGEAPHNPDEIADLIHRVETMHGASVDSMPAGMYLPGSSRSAIF